MVATTTTAMLFRELAAVGPVVMDVDDEGLTVKLREALTQGGTVAAVRGLGGGGKVVGLPPSVVDALWAARLADHLLVEADGSRGLPFKAFGPHEPQVPAASTIVVQVAGLDAIGRPLTMDHVHRAERMAAALGVPLGCEVTQRVLVDGLKLQLSALQAGAARPRIVSLLNGVDTPAAEALGLTVASDLLEPDGGLSVVVLACLRERRAAKVLASAA